VKSTVASGGKTEESKDKEGDKCQSEDKKLKKN
jgi:hypothetical protein